MRPTPLWERITWQQRYFGIKNKSNHKSFIHSKQYRNEEYFKAINRK